MKNNNKKTTNCQITMIDYRKQQTNNANNNKASQNSCKNKNNK